MLEKNPALQKTPRMPSFLVLYTGPPVAEDHAMAGVGEFTGVMVEG